MNDQAPPSLPRPVEWACLRVERSLAAVPAAAAAMAGWLKDRGAAPGRGLEELELAVTEALTNAVRHGGGGREDYGVRLAWCWRSGEVEAEVSEPGNFQPTASWHELPEDPLAEGGRGGFLITELMDAVEHRNDGGRHALRLRKRLGATTPETAAAVAAELEAMTEELGNAYETIAALFGLAEDLATSAGLRAMAEKSLARLLPLLGADAAWVRLRRAGGTLRLLAAEGAARAPLELAESADCTETTVATGGGERAVERLGELPPVDPLRADTGCALVCPFAFEGNLRGLLAVTRTEDGDFFTAAQAGLARTMADFLGIACANAELQAQRRDQAKARHELEIAARIQEALLPREVAPHRAWRVEGVCAQAAEVGGDFFDVVDRTDGTRLVVVADVMGKGVPAALMATTLRTALRTLAPLVAGPGELLTRVNRLLCADLGRIDMFITAQVVWLEPGGEAARLANGGHCTPLLAEADGSLRWWDTIGGLPVGVAAEEVYEERRHETPAGSRLWLMTDGATEQENEAGEELGPEGVATLAARCRHPAELLTILHGAGARDDCTLVLIEPTRENPTT